MTKKTGYHYECPFTNFSILVGECNIQCSTKRIWCSTDLEVGVLHIRLPQLTYFIVGFPKHFPQQKYANLPSLPRVEILTMSCSYFGRLHKFILKLSDL